MRRLLLLILAVSLVSGCVDGQVGGKTSPQEAQKAAPINPATGSGQEAVIEHEVDSINPTNNDTQEGTGDQLREEILKVLESGNKS